jgi:hypothetical protein
MRRSRAQSVVLSTVATCVLVLLPAAAETIDPTEDDSQYAYGENIGWLNAEPGGDGGNGIQVSDTELTGWMWGENVGWISLSCQNTGSCGTVSYGVSNDGCGDLSGYAWAENVGWINFSPSTAGVDIDPQTGDFSGQAWGENIGWIAFNCSTTMSCGTVDYKVKTSWVRSPPPGSAGIGLSHSGTTTTITWSELTDASVYDLVEGDLNTLHGTGSFTSATTGCLAENTTVRTATHSAPVTPGEGWWFLVRGQNCGGESSYGSGLRDSEINAAAGSCN